MANFTATFHIDGAVDCTTLQLGILSIGSEKFPAVRGEMITEPQRYSFWALDRLAVVIYCYVLAAKRLYDEPEPLQANLAGVLISGTSNSLLSARSMTWHTSASIRSLAERLITELAADGNLTTNWPGKEKLIMPVATQAVQAARTYPHGRTNSRV